MRKLASLASGLLAACATAPQPSGTLCNAEAAGGFIGQMGSGETGSAILRATHARVLRWAPPGVMLTMDFSPTRVTVRLGPDGKITAVNCG